MKSALLFLSAYFIFQFAVTAQQTKPSVDGKAFLIQTEVDQIVYYNTNGQNGKLDPTIYSSFLYKEDHGAALTKLLPLYYENKRVVTDTAIIRGIIQAMPNDTCAKLPVQRCGTPTYRDIILFYNKNKLVFTLKVCMECSATVSMPYKTESKCLAHDMQNVYLNILGYTMFNERKW
jgi:ribosomal protein L40E